MKIEIVELYTNKFDLEAHTFTGSMHIYIIQPDNRCFDIRGIFVNKNSKGWSFHMPCQFGYDQETGERVRYPIFEFAEEDRKIILKKFLNAEGKLYARAFRDKLIASGVKKIG